MVKTNIPIFDDRIGGIPPGKKILLSVTPGLDVSAIGLHFVHSFLEAGHPVCYIVDNKFPTIIRRGFKSYGWDVEHYENEGLLRIVDGFSGYMGADSQEPHHVDLTNVTAVEVLVQECEDTNTIIVFDSISSFLDMNEDCTRALYQMIERSRASLLGLFVNWDFGDDEEGGAHTRALKALFNGILELKPLGESLVIKQFLSVTKADWATGEEHLAVPIKVLKPGGIRTYVPKVIVTGDYNAGKSSIIHMLSTDAVSVDRMGTTIALDHGYVDYRGFQIDVFGTPGQERFDPIIQFLAQDTHAIIVVFDLSRTADTVVRTMKVMDTCGTHDIPTVVAANKHDLRPQSTMKEVQHMLRFDGEVVFTSTVQGTGREALLDALIRVVFKPDITGTA